MASHSNFDSRLAEPEAEAAAETDQAPRRILDSDQVHSEGPSREEVAALAYEFWVERGSPHGSHEEDWHRAEEHLRGRQDTLTQAAIA